MKVKLDATTCLTAYCEPGKKKIDYWDTVTTGFVLEVRSSGGKTYYLRYFDQNGRQRQLKIGACQSARKTDPVSASKSDPHGIGSSSCPGSP